MLVLVVEDDADYADVIAETLRFASHEVAVASTLDGAQRFASRARPNLAVVDVSLPDGSGLDLCRALRRHNVELPVILLSNLDRNSDVVAGLDAGADDYMTKPFHPSELVARVNAVARRHGVSCDRTQAQRPAAAPTGLFFDEERSTVLLNGEDLGCTETEYLVLRELASAPDQVFTHGYLNSRVWNYPNMRDARLLKGHVSSIRQKLRAIGCTEELIRTVHGVGYSFNEAALPRVATPEYA